MGTDIHGVLESRCQSGWLYEGLIEDARNYRLFAALAGVRNGTGFAGVATHEAVVPIAEPRGLPEDFRGSVEDGYRDIDPPAYLGDHSHSWLTLDEIEAWPYWDKVLHETGVISREQFAKWDRRSAPDGWSGAVDGYRVVVANAALEDFPEGWTYVQVEWHTRTMRDACSVWWHWMAYARAKTAPYEARVVFGFDS